MATEYAYALVLSTVPSREVGKTIARAVVRARLAACVNVVPGLVSIYEWKGKLEEEEEALLVMKTTRERVEELIERVVKLHPYDVPEVIAMPVAAGHGKYLSWLDSCADSEPIPEDSPQ